ncbi:MAG: radical SAM family heme chaperone HemW [Brumimicrobium sp.]|nr:radical SAM family heme chaperone HemW [Brumimicrobium sp.]
MAGIYIHIPFCKQKCSYCDFHFSTTYQGYRTKMISAMLHEIKLQKAYLKNEMIETLYFGGGTPSLLTKEELQSIIQIVFKTFLNVSIKEFTLEANPDDINEVTLSNWKELGVNRLSIGVQSFFQEDLDWMNRAHTAKESTEAVLLAQKMGFSLSVDLIYGLPNRTLVDWKHNLDKLIAIRPEHISAYCLTIEKRTALNKMIQTKQLPKVEEEAQAQQFELMVNELSKVGYEQYEISNFARDAHYSIHNSSYWKGVHYIGIGPSAHSYDGKSRQWNIANNQLYIKKVLSGETYFEKEVLSLQDQFNELILTGLRTKWGVSRLQLSDKLKLPEEFKKQLEKFKELRLIHEENNTLYLTEKGKLQADYIASMLFIELD